MYGNLGENFPSIGTAIFFRTVIRNEIELYHLQNTGKFFAFSQEEGWLWKSKQMVQKISVVLVKAEER